MSSFVPAEVFPPGEFIREELDARGWTQADLADIMHRPLPTINQLVAGKKAITAETALGLSEAFGTSADFWLNLESAYRLSLVKDESGGAVERRAKLYGAAPVKEMMRRQWIKQTTDPDELEHELLSFFGVKSIAECERFAFAAKKGATYDASTPEQRAWAVRVRNLAKAVRVAPFDRAKFAAALPKFRHLITHETDVSKVPASLADMGVRFVLVEHLTRSYMDGAALWLDESSPVIGVSTRFDRIDNFWFCLCHELMHILHGDEVSIDEKLFGEGAVPIAEKPEFEQRADRAASEFLVPAKELENFILRIRPLYYRTKIIQFANRLRIHPGIIVGQLQYRGELTYKQLRDELVKVRDKIKATSLSDGWGFAPLAK